MQESFSEITLAELPLVIFNMARGQQDYYQATRGGGHGDYRHIVLAPQDVTEGVELVQLAFHLADKWRNPVLVYGDYLLAHTQEAISIEPIDVPRAARRRTGRSTARARAAAASRSVTPLGVGKAGQRALGQEGKAQYIATKLPLMEREVRVETGFLDDAETVDRRVRLAGEVREVRDPPAARRRPPHRLRAADHAVAVPVRDGRRRRGGLERAAHRQLRALAPARWSTTCASASPGRAPVDVHRRRVDRPAPASASGASSTSSVIAERILALHEDRELPLIPGYEVNSYALQPHQAEATR